MTKGRISPYCCGGKLADSCSSYRLRLTTLPSRMQRHSPVLSVAVGSGTHMMMEYDDTDTIVMMGETGATIQRVPD